MKILVVDDVSAARDNIKKALNKRRTDIEIIEAENGEEGVTKYKAERPDIVVLDIDLPIKDGFEVLKEIKEFDTNCKVIVTTGMNGNMYLVESYRLGAKKFITKPYDLNNLIDIILELLKGE